MVTTQTGIDAIPLHHLRCPVTHERIHKISYFLAITIRKIKIEKHAFSQYFMFNLKTNEINFFLTILLFAFAFIVHCKSNYERENRNL